MDFLADGDRRYLPFENGYFIQGGILTEIKITILGSECQTSGTCSKRAKQETKIDNAAACLCCLNYLASFRPVADRAVSKLPWVVSRGRSYGFLWAGSIIQKNVRKGNPTPAYSPVSERPRKSTTFEIPSLFLQGWLIWFHNFTLVCGQAIISRWSYTIHVGIVFTYSWCLYLTLELWNGVDNAVGPCTYNSTMVSMNCLTLSGD
jgi:hypothetical protein